MRAQFTSNVPGHTPGIDPPADNPGPRYGQTPAGPVHRPPTRVHPAELVQIRRELFWQNVVRDVLMGLAAAAAADAGRLTAKAGAAAAGVSPDSEMFDGRMGIITVQGQRIPIADVVPVFACTGQQSTDEHGLSDDIQCSIFRIRTPSGESYTLPVTQIVGVHSMSDELADQLEQAARDMEETDKDGNQMPFGFAAYTSLARAESKDDAPESPQDAAENDAESTAGDTENDDTAKGNPPPTPRPPPASPHSKPANP